MDFGKIAGIIADAIEIECKQVSMISGRCYALEPTNSIRASIGDDVVILWDWCGKAPPDII